VGGSAASHRGRLARFCEQVGLNPDQQDELVKGAYTVGFGHGSMHELEQRMKPEG
jgi:hypothetical protein